MKLLEEIKDKYLDSRYEEVSSKLDTLEEDLRFIPKPKDLGDYNRYINAISKILSEVESLSLSYTLRDIKELLENHYEQIISEHKLKEIEINDKFEALVNQKVDAIETEAKEHNKQIVEDFHKENSVFIQLEEKRKSLEGYSEDIVNLCSSYGITTSDITIDNSSFTVEELDEIYDEYIDYMSKVGSRKNPIGWFRNKFDNIIFQGVVLLMIMVLSFTIILDFVAIIFFGAIVYNQLKAKEKMKTYSVLLGLVFNIRPLEMGFKNELDEDKLISEEVNEDEDARLKIVAKAWENALKELDENDPSITLEEERVCLASNASELQEEMNILIQAFKELRDGVASDIRKIIKDYKEEFEELKSKVKLLGDEITESPIFKTSFRLGCKEGVIEEHIEIGLSNIIIHPSRDEDKMKAFLQVLLANAFCNVKANNLSVVVYDPNKFGQDLVSFYKPELESILVFKNNTLDSTIDDLKKYASNNMKDMRGVNINEFNEASQKVGRTTKDYKLLIVLSQPKTIEEDEALTEFMTYSAKLGVFVWLVTNKEMADTVIFKEPFQGIANPYKIDFNTFGPKVADTLINAIENSKTESLSWEDFINVAVPDKDTWTYVTDQFVDLDPGFYEGDPTQFKGYTVGNEGNVHVIGVGGTGAGKSVFLNHLIATACKKYSPRELELWLVDYKGVEFKFYLPSDKNPYMLPHIKACLCTSDGDYAGSLYTALRIEAERRYNLLKEVGYKNIKDYNKFLRAAGREDETIPRIIFINDEFQVIFEKAEPKIIEQINKDITYISKVARAAGIHLFFTSQSMKKTISADILQQFTLRFALRCDEEVSMAVLGTKFASSIKQKFGYLYVRSLEDISLEAQKRYRTPYASDDILREHIKKMALLADERNMPKHDVITYEESTIHDISELDKFYEDAEAWEGTPKQLPDYGLFVLGNRMTYSTNKAPDNIMLQAVNNSHIISAFSDTKDLINFYRTMQTNIKHFKTDTMVFCNSQVADLHYLCELDKDVSEEMQELSNEKASIYELLDLFEGIYNTRVENGIKEQPVYFILIGWDKAVGFGIDKDSMFTSKFAKLLQICGEYNMHFIFINSSVSAIGTNIIAACKYRITGSVDEATSFALLNTKQGSKPSDMKNGYMYICRNGEVTRAKLYQSIQEREVKKNEFVL